MELHLIYAVAHNGVIGNKGKMPWCLPEDLAHFKHHTMGHAVIMGRKTWESLPIKYRPLPGRTNIVLTNQKDWDPYSSEVIVVNSLLEALFEAGPVKKHSKAFVIGGAELLKQSLPIADSVILTEIDATFEGDTFVPKLGTEWLIETENKETHISTSNDLSFSFNTYRKQPK